MGSVCGSREEHRATQSASTGVVDGHCNNEPGRGSRLHHVATRPESQSPRMVVDRMDHRSGLRAERRVLVLESEKGSSQSPNLGGSVASESTGPPDEPVHNCGQPVDLVGQEQDTEGGGVNCPVDAAKSAVPQNSL